MSFESYMTKHEIINDNEKYNFVICGTNPFIKNTSQKFFIDPKEINYFYSRCCDFLYDDPKHFINFGQVMPEIAPLCLDFDIKTYYNESYEHINHIYDYDDILKLIKIINNIIFNNFEINKEDIKAYVLEKKRFKLIDNSTLKDGLHIIYILPFNSKQRWFIRDQLVEELEGLNFFGKYNPFNDYSDIVDDAIIDRNPWLSYGSIKAITKKIKNKSGEIVKKLEKSSPYILTQIINFDGYDEYTEDIIYNDEELMAMFNLEQFNESDLLDEKSEIIKAYKHKENKKTPNINISKSNNLMSSTISKANDKSLSNIERIRRNREERRKKEQQKQEEELKLDDYSSKIKPVFTFEILMRIVKLLKDNDQTYTQYKKWFEISCALYIHAKINKLTDEQIKTIIQTFSEDYERFDEDNFENFDYPMIQKAALKYKYSYNKFMNEIHNTDAAAEKEIKRMIFNKAYDDNLGDCNDVDIADYIYETNKYNYICTDTKNNTWYYFPSTDEDYNRLNDETKLNIEDRRFVWEKSLNAVCIYNCLIDLYYETKERRKELYKKVLKEDYESKINNTDNQDNRSFKAKITIDVSKNTKMSNYNELIHKLGNSGSQSAIVKMCANKFYNRKLNEKLNEEKDIICFNNGYYDLRTQEFKDPDPTKYSTFSTGYDYIDFSDDNYIIEKNIKELNEKSIKTCGELKKEVYDYMHSLFPDKEDMDYMFRFCASLLSGRLIEESIHIWTGNASNGKSLFNNFLKTVLGDYYSTASTGLITQKRGNSSNASPELANKKGKRVIVVNEPESDDMIYVGRMKELTGQDHIETRALYSDPITFKPQFRLILICNHIPLVSGYDEGTWRRIKIISFNSKFSDNKVDHKNHIFKIDHIVKKKIDHKIWTQCFMWILLNKYYPIVKKDDKLGTTKNMRKNLEEFKMINDEIRAFIRANYKTVGHENITLEYPFHDDSISEENKTDIIHWSELYKAYKEWHEMKNGNKQYKTWEHIRKHIREYLSSEGVEIKSLDMKDEGQDDFIIGLKYKSKLSKSFKALDDY